MPTPVDLFISYSHKDEDLKDRLGVHLSSMQQQGVIRVWHDRKVLAGIDWEQEISKHIDEARLILLLVSPDFLASRYCYGKEMRRAIELRKEGRADILPIILSPCDLKGLPFADLAVLPRDARPVTSWPTAPRYDEGWLDVVRGIRATLERPSSPAPVQQPPSERRKTEGVQWTREDVRPTRVVLSSDGESVLAGCADGTLMLLDRLGKEVWRYQFETPIEAVACSDPASLFVAGAWSGEVRACVSRGVEWVGQTAGVVSALAVTRDRDVIAGSWSGDVTFFDSEGVSIGQTRLHDAVVALVAPPRDGPVIAALADRTLAALDPDGSVRWRHTLGARLEYLVALDFQFLAATEDGGLVWLSDDGTVAQTTQIPGGITHVGASRDGTWVAWIDRGSRLSCWQPNRKGGALDVQLGEPPDALAVTGQGERTCFTVALPSARLVTYDRHLRPHATRLTKRISTMSLSAPSTQAAALTHDTSSLVYIALAAEKDRLPEARLTVDMSAPDALVKGRLGKLWIKLTNEGQRDAHNIEVKIRSDSLSKPELHAVGMLPAGKDISVPKSVEPIKTGDVQIHISVRYEDEHRRQCPEVTLDPFIKVNEPYQDGAVSPKPRAPSES